MRPTSILVLSMLAAAPGFASAGEDCGAFLAPPENAKGATQQSIRQKPIDAKLLLGSAGAVRCIVEETRRLAPRVTSPAIEPDVDAQLVRLTGAARTVLVNRGAAAVAEFREAGDAEFVATLAFAARSEAQNLRVNATRVLADIVDNNNVCVVIDHLYDPELDTSPHGPSGRVNLLGVVSVQAIWAYRENHANIETLVRETRRRLEGQPEVSQTLSVLDNIDQRLRYQASQGGGSSRMPLPPDQRRCADYSPVWANQGRARLVY
jgi:hypothetical protein